MKKYGDKYTEYSCSENGKVYPREAIWRFTKWGDWHTNAEGDYLCYKDRIVTYFFTVRGCNTEKAAKAEIRKAVIG